MSGIIGGFMSTLIVTPIEYIKINKQNNIIINYNIKKMYKGFIPTICRETPGFGIYFSTYENLNSFYNKEKHYYKNFIFGGLSGLSAWIFIYPMDLVKTKIQCNNNNNNIKQIIREIYNKNGLISFYKGFHYSAIRAIPLHSGVFLGYEFCNNHINKFI
jgi:hypothetical protein